MRIRFRPSGPRLIGREIAVVILAFVCAGLAGYGAMRASIVFLIRLGAREQLAGWAGIIAFIAVLILGSLAIDAMHHKRLGGNSR
jgi:hypothetical protein